MATVDAYLDHITSFHRGKPRFAATVSALVQPLADLQGMVGHLPADFDLDAAIGAQLDVVGEWVGRSRFIPTPIPDLYFSFDDPVRGFEKGIWKGPYDSETGINRLDDDIYRLLLRAKIAANTWDGSVAGAQAAFDTIFSVATGTRLFVQDNGDMSMTVAVAGVIPSVLFLMLMSKGYLPLKPGGVRAYYSVTSINNTPLFGFDVQNEFVAGFDSGSWGVPPDYIAQHAT